jgi:hypothetical protein
MLMFDSMFGEERFNRYKNNLTYRTFKYLVDGNTVNGYVIKPKLSKHKLPVLIYNRGGNGNFYQTIDSSSSFRIFLATYDENNKKNAISKYVEYKLSSISEWQKFEIMLPISHEVSYVNIGGVLTGKGLALVDEMNISFPTCKARLAHFNP